MVEHLDKHVALACAALALICMFAMLFALGGVQPAYAAEDVVSGPTAEQGETPRSQASEMRDGSLENATGEPGSDEPDAPANQEPDVESADANASEEVSPESQALDAQALSAGEPEGGALGSDAEPLSNEPEAPQAGVAYIISSAKAPAKVVDVAGGSTDARAAIQIYGDNRTAAQRWVFNEVGDGYVEIVNVKSNLALDVTGGKAAKGTPIQQYRRNNTKAQKWKPVSLGDGFFTFVSALSDKLVLDLAGGKTEDRTRLQLWSPNSTPAQSWHLGEVAQLVDNGYYTLLCECSGKALDVSGASFDKRANIKQYASNGSLGQIYRVSYERKTGYYTLKAICSNMVVNAQGGGTVKGTNVQQYTPNGTLAQMWDITMNANGAYTLRSAKSGLAIDVKGASKQNSANVQLHTNNNTPAQQWAFKKVSKLVADGTYLLASALNTGLAVSVKDGSSKAGAPVVTARRTALNGVAWQLRSKGNGAYTLQNPYSGLYLNAAVTNEGVALRTGSLHQEWVIGHTARGFALFLKENASLALDVKAASKTAGAIVQTHASNGTNAQRFLLMRAAPLSDGTYVIHSSANWNKVLDVAGGSKDNAANVQLYKSNGTAAQQWDIRRNSNGTYFIASAKSGRVLDVAGAKAAEGANVHIWTGGNASNQQWTFSVDEQTGALTFSSKLGSGLVLGFAGSSPQDKANIVVAKRSSDAARQWRLDAVSYAAVDRWDGFMHDYRYDNAVNQLLFVKYTGGTHATVELHVKSSNVWTQKLSCAANVGENGMGVASEWASITPSGNFGITSAFGIKSNPGTAGIGYVKVNGAHYWCGDDYYNQLIDINEKPHYCTGEHLIDYAGAYDYGLFYDYNTNPVRRGAGFAYFVHCFTSRPYTAGCIAVSRDNMVRIIRNMGKGARLLAYNA